MYFLAHICDPIVPRESVAGNSKCWEPGGEGRPLGCCGEITWNSTQWVLRENMVSPQDCALTKGRGSNWR